MRCDYKDGHANLFVRAKESVYVMASIPEQNRKMHDLFHELRGMVSFILKQIGDSDWLDRVAIAHGMREEWLCRPLDGVYKFEPYKFLEALDAAAITDNERKRYQSIKNCIVDNWAAMQHYEYTRINHTRIAPMYFSFGVYGRPP
jgi:hypothetical protein